MSLITLADAKTMLGISGSGEDAALTIMLRSAAQIIRNETKLYLGGLITTISAADPAVCTAIGHGLKDGDKIVVSGSDSGVTINGLQTITYLTADTFSVAVDNTAGSGGSAGTTARYIRQYTEYYSGKGQGDLWLRETPVTTIDSLYLDSDGYWGQGDSPYATADLLTAGTDYILDVREDSLSTTGRVVRINNIWPGKTVRHGGLLATSYAQSLGNIKATYRAGYDPLPGDLIGACALLLQVMRKASENGGPVTSESIDYYSYQLASNEEATEQLGNVKSTLRRYRGAKGWVV